MKPIIVLFMLGLTFHSYAENGDKGNTIDDLSTIDLNLDISVTKQYDIHYPNYRIGGGNGPMRKIQDCLLLDIKHSDAVVSLEQKLKLAKKLMVMDGALSENAGIELAPRIKGRHVVFYMKASTYVTILQIKTLDGRSFNEILTESLPPVRVGNGKNAPTGLVYVRDCRF